ncbi:MAG: hypothetical protein Fur0037_28680 [Planctomycetota bacterium]
MPASRPFAAVWFDCDSTLSRIEGVDEILGSSSPELRREILDLTRAAMEGRVPLAGIYETRIERVAPTREMLARVGRRYVECAVPDAGAVCEVLRWLGKRIGILSGGLLPAVRVLADHLGVPSSDVHAVPIRFRPDGTYAGFDRSSPLWRNRGKVEVIAGLPAAFRPFCFVGDGVTDLETRGTADLFVGFGGVEVREPVRLGADCWCETPSLAGILPFVLTAEELAAVRREPRFADLAARLSEESAP